MANEIIKSFKVDRLNVEVFHDRIELGRKAAADVSGKIGELLAEGKEVRMIFAAAPSQEDMLRELAMMDDIEWSKVTAFHMDEYIGISNTAPQAFGQFLKERLFDKVGFKKVNYLYTESDNTNELCSNYVNLLSEAPIDIVCMGIGENGHIAFNDPPYADFNDSELVKVVELDEVSRQQQVNDGCFSSIDEVPKKAVTLTIPSLLAGENLFVVVPGKTKRVAISKSLQEPITADCPASILRRHDNAKLYLDIDSAALINDNI